MASNMAKKRYANDWKKINDEVEYSEELNLYFYRGVHYDHRSATHNGIVGMGRSLKSVIKKHNGEV
jgi:hypothetical protein